MDAPDPKARGVLHLGGGSKVSGQGWGRLVMGRAEELSQGGGEKKKRQQHLHPLALTLELSKEDERGDWEQGLIRVWPCT